MAGGSGKDRISARADGRLFFVRRVPKHVAHLDKRGVIRQSLRTHDPIEAAIRARAIDESLEDYWGALARGESAESSWDRHAAAVDLARSFGFVYRPIGEQAAVSEDLERRLSVAVEHIHVRPVVEAVMGVVDPSRVRLSELYGIFAAQKRLELDAMSEAQRRKDKNERIRAAGYAIGQMGDLYLDEITRPMVQSFKQWWVEKVLTEGLTVEAANRSFANLKGMITVVDAKLQTEHSTIWRSINLKATAKTKSEKRPPYPIAFVQDQLLAPGALDGLNTDATLIVLLMVETGLRLTEACNLRRQDLVVDRPIPFVVIEERSDRVQKTESSIRQVPLVGVSLWAAKQALKLAPAGEKVFHRYWDRGARASAAINKYLRENGLRPTPKHSIYSMRHTFQDRILAAKALDRVQADLMGHAFEREEYGDGATLEAKLEVLDGIKFKWSVPDPA